MKGNRKISMSRRIKMLLKLITIVCTIMVGVAVVPIDNVNAAAKEHNRCTHKSYWKYSYYSSKFTGESYSRWHAQNVTFRASRAGEQGVFLLNKSKTVKTKGSINVKIPLKELSAKLGYEKTISKTVSSTIYGSASASLKKDEYCRHYYRDHWKKYKVVEKARLYCRDCQKYIDTKYVTKYISVPQKVTYKDYGWKYGWKSSDLPDEK